MAATALTVSGTLSGGAAPLVGSYVTAYDATTSAWAGNGVSDNAGAYSLTLPAGTYKLLVQPNTAGYPNVWYGAAGATFATATPVTLPPSAIINLTVP